MVVTVEDIIRAIQDRPEVREQVRRAVLTDELLALPQKFAELTAQVSENTTQIAALTTQVAQNTTQVAQNTTQISALTTRMDALTTQVAQNRIQISTLTDQVRELTIQVRELAVQVKELAAQVAKNTTQISSLTTRMAENATRMDAQDVRTQSIEDTARWIHNAVVELIGDKLEREAAHSITPRLTQMLGLRRTRVVYHKNLIPDNAFLTLVEDATEAGKITDEQEGRVKQTDLIIRARRKADGLRIWIAVEASGTIAETDIERAANTASALKAVFDEDTYAAVVGYRIRSEDEDRANAAGVIVMSEHSMDDDEE